jgi:hypothetical protein
MLLFAGCDDNHTTPCDNQWRKHADIEYGKYAKDSVYIAKGMFVATKAIDHVRCVRQQ